MDGSKIMLKKMLHLKTGVSYLEQNNLLVTGEFLDTPEFQSFIKIIVDPSELKIPNVFTPNNDGINDNFMVESKSLRILSVEIFSRSGRNVYSFYGESEILREWKGWDGNVNSSSTKATPGVYFYIIRAYGWDDVIYDSKEYRGFVYLYR